MQYITTALIAFMLVHMAGSCFAQTEDAATRYPELRLGAVSVDVMGKGQTTSLLNGNTLYKGDIQLTREQANFNIPIASWQKISLIATVSYSNQHFDITQVQDFNPDYKIPTMHFSEQTVGFGLTYAVRDSLFGKPMHFINTVSAFSDNASSIKKVNYQGVLTFLVNRTRTSSLTLGVAVIIDPSTPSPVLPVMYYWQQFRDKSLELFVDVPNRILLRKAFSSRDWLSAGTTRGGSFSFFTLDQPPLPRNDTYSTFELKTGLSYEHLLCKKILVGVNGGLFSTLTARAFKQNTNPDDYFLKYNNSGTNYVNY